MDFIILVVNNKLIILFNIISKWSGINYELL